MPRANEKTTSSKRRPVALRHEEVITAGSGKAEVLHRWIEADLDGGWTVAARVLTRDGWPEVAELRYFPTPAGDGGVETSRPLGTWDQDDQTVPERGLLHDVLHSVPLRLMKEREHRIARQFAITDEILDQPLPATPRRPGRKGNPPEIDAHIAAIYVDELRRGSKGVHARTAARLGTGYTSKYVSKRIDRCRERGLLTRTLPGKAGGELTDLAKAALRPGSPPST